MRLLTNGRTFFYVTALQTNDLIPTWP
ncbi:hypothetical protein MNBD_CHLOROFLEXI01-1430, partial [hydrothermal vent metagenome]